MDLWFCIRTSAMTYNEAKQLKPTDIVLFRCDIGPCKGRVLNLEYDPLWNYPNGGGYPFYFQCVLDKKPCGDTRRSPDGSGHGLCGRFDVKNIVMLLEMRDSSK